MLSSNIAFSRSLFHLIVWVSLSPLKSWHILLAVMVHARRDRLKSSLLIIHDFHKSKFIYNWSALYSLRLVFYTLYIFKELHSKAIEII